MPRIRTFKPEFFRSPDTAKASPLARLLYMAMWSWANDEGIGETNLYGLLGFAFPDDDELTVKDLQRLLKEVRGSFGVLFYEHHGRFYYSIPSWDSHQKTERRAAGRNPRPDDPDSRPDLRFGNSAENLGNSFTGTGEQGNAGTEESCGSGSQVCHQSTDDVPPPRKCPQHINDPHPPSCPLCADARHNNDAWKTQQQKQERDQLEVRRRQREIANNCPTCHGTNVIDIGDNEVRKCDHQEAVNG